MKLAQKIIGKLENIHPLYIFTVLFLLTLIVYGVSLSNGFVWDDEEQIVNNAIIQNLHNIPYLFTASTFNTGGAGGLSGWYYKPLMPFVFSIIFWMFGNNAFGFHLFDIFLHFINGVLIFILFRKIFLLQKLRFATAIPFILSMIFIVHPANTESVAYISSTQELLYVFFMLFALLFTFRYSLNKTHSLRDILLINLFIFLSLLSKESGVITIALVIIFAYLFKGRKIIAIILSSVITFIIYLILRFPVAKTPIFEHQSIVPIANATLYQRLTTVPFELFSYIRLIFFPKDLFVAQHTVVKSVNDPRFYVYLPIALFFFSALIFLCKKIKSKSYLFFFIWFILSLSIIINIYPLDMTVAERWLYGPIIGFLGMLGISISNIKNNQVQTAILMLLLFLIPIFSIRTIERNFNWKDDLTLFSHDIKYSKNSFDAQNNLGVALFRKGDLKDAKVHFEESIRLSPKWWTSYSNLGVIYQRAGNLKKADDLYTIAIKNGGYYLAYENKAEILYETATPKQTLSFVLKGLKYLPFNETLNKIAALEYQKIGDITSAKEYARKTFEIDPTQENYLILHKILNY